MLHSHAHSPTHAHARLRSMCCAAHINFALAGKPTTEKDYPSNQRAEKKKDDVANAKVLRGRYVVSWLRCSLPSCRKPRVLFKATPLTAEEKVAVTQLDENTMYSCGAPVTMAGHSLHGHLVARSSLRCSDPVEFDYYILHQDQEIPSVLQPVRGDGGSIDQISGEECNVSRCAAAMQSMPSYEG